MEKKSISSKKIFLRLYVCIFGIMVLIHFISELSNGGEVFPMFWMTIIGDACTSFLFLSPFLLITRSVKEAARDVKFESMSRIDFFNDKEYYREILKNYSISELSYIDDFNIDYPKDIIATLLVLKLKKKITISNNLIEILDFNTADLKKSEIYVLENIKDGKVKIKNSHDIISYAESEALEDNLIVAADFNAKSTIKKLILEKIVNIFRVIIALMAIFSLIFILPDNIIFVFIIIFGYLIMFLVSSIPFIFIKIGSYLLIKSKSYKRNEFGEQINKKIEGLKNYIKDFSILDERCQQELLVWEEYLIYSVLFNQNQKIIDNLSSLVEAEYEVGKIYFEPSNTNSSNN